VVFSTLHAGASEPLPFMESWLVATLVALGTIISAAAEDEAKVSKANVGISVMLLGSIGFMMALFELTHCYIKPMQKYSWKAISATISIFSAVLIFQGVNGLVEAYVLEGASEQTEVWVSIVHMLLWFLILQCVLAFVSGAVGGRFKVSLEDEDSIETMETRLKCFAVLLGHITGFAAINAFATIQQQVPRVLANTFMVPLLAWLCVFLFGRVTDHARDWISLSDDGTKDTSEEKWEEETAETEDDVVGLAVSFCFVQSLRFWVSGILPNTEGEEPLAIAVGHSDAQCLFLFGIGIVLVILETFRIVYVRRKFFRLSDQMKNVTAMTFSWCLFFAVDWFVSAHLFGSEQGMMKQVILALVVTTLALGCIFFLQTIESLESTGDSLDGALRAVVNAIGILIGFAWERAFDTAVAEVSETVSLLPQPWTKLLLAVGLAGMVVPAWKRHILPTIMKIEAEEEKEDEKGEGVPEDIERNEATGTLQDPLLRPEGVDDLRAACRVLEEKITTLESCTSRMPKLQQQNAVLEAKMGGISKELGDLEKLASLLTT